MGIFIAALITTVLAILAVGFLIKQISKTEDRRLLILTFFFTLPAQPIAYYFFRVPLHDLLTDWIGAGALLTTITLFYAPVMEEPAKWFALGVPSIKKGIRPENAIAVALAAGLGFGVGEIWFLATQLWQSSQLASLPFWHFGGFLLERLLVCFLHGAFVVLLFKRFAEGRSLWPAALLGIALHFALNFPIHLAAINVPPLGREVWPLALLAYILLFTLVAFLFVLRLGQTPSPSSARDKGSRA